MQFGSLRTPEGPNEMWLSVAALVLMLVLASGGYFLLRYPSLIGFQSRSNVQRTVRFEGSDTELPMVMLLTSSYARAHPGTAFEVRGGGSNLGITDFLNGKLDGAMSSRRITRDEALVAMSHGIKLQEFTFAQDAIAIIVNAHNPVSQLTFTQLAHIYTATTTLHWKQFGGSDAEIHAYGTNELSGTHVYMKDSVLKGANYATRVREMVDVQSVLDAVSADAQGIGYVGVGYVTDISGKPYAGIRVVAVSQDDRTFFSPLDSKVVYTHEYPLVRSLYLYLREPPVRGSSVEGFLQFVGSNAGQEIIRKSGYFNNSPDVEKKNQNVIDGGQ